MLIGGGGGAIVNCCGVKELHLREKYNKKLRCFERRPCVGKLVATEDLSSKRRSSVLYFSSCRNSFTSQL